MPRFLDKSKNLFSEDNQNLWRLGQIADKVKIFSWPNKIADDVFNAGSGIVVSGGGQGGSQVNTIDFIQTSTEGNASDFGDLTATSRENHAYSNETRMVISRGTDSDSTVLDFITPSTTGDAADFGDLANGTRSSGASGDAIRGYSYGGSGSNEINDIQQISYSSKGNANDFGDLTRVHVFTCGSGDATRGVVLGGFTSPNNMFNTVDYIVYSSTGDAVDFGDLASARRGGSGPSSSTRIVQLGGNTSGATGQMDYFTTQTLGNGTDFGDLAVAAREQGYGNTSNSIKGFSMGGYSDPSSAYVNNIQQITISTTANSTDFGDLTVARGVNAAAGNKNGGLPGARGTSLRAPTPFDLQLHQYSNNNTVLIGPGDDRHFQLGYVNLATQGNENDFADTLVIRRLTGMGGDTIRGFIIGGYNASGSQINNIESVVFAHKGKASDWGDLTGSDAHARAHGNNSRVVRSSGDADNDVLDYFSPTSTGNATDFGDLSLGRSQCGATGSTTRGIWAGGATGPSEIASIDYITIASAGNATDFGDIASGAQSNCVGGSSNTRSLGAGGYNASDQTVNIIFYLTIASTGDSTDFGDLTSARSDHAGASNQTRCAWFSGGGNANTIDFVTIASTGNAASFGEMKDTGRNHQAESNGHGGLPAYA